MADIKNVQIFAVGTWNGWKFVPEDLEEIVMNTNALLLKGTNKPPLKLGHSTNQILKGQSDGDPALGRAVNFRVKNNTIITDFMNVSDIIIEAIEKEKYNTVSVEMEHIKNFGWFVKAVALLGADISAVKVIDDLQAFLSDADLPSTPSIQLGFSEPLINYIKEDVMSKEDKDKTLTKDPPATPDVITPNVTVNLPPANKELEKKFTDAQADLIKEKGLVKDRDAKLKEYEQKEIERAFTEQRAEILKDYKEDAKAGKLMPALVGKIETHLDSQKITFTEDSQLSLSPELVREVAKAYRDLPSKETALSDGETVEADPSEIIRMEVAKTRQKTGMSFADAEEAVFDANPAMWKDYVKWTDDISAGRI